MSLTIVTLANLSNTQADASSIITTVYDAFELNFFASIGACQIQIRDPSLNFIFVLNRLVTYKHSVSGSKSAGKHVTNVRIDMNCENLILKKLI